MNWYIHGSTDLKVGFGRDGESCEGGCCEHLNVGDVAAGYSGEADEWGREEFLMCGPCYNQFQKDRLEELTECKDCKVEVPFNRGSNYTPYDSECTHAERMNSRFFVCNNCKAASKHQARLERDRQDRDKDLEAMYDPEDFDHEDDLPLHDGDGDEGDDLDGGSEDQE